MSKQMVTQYAGTFRLSRINSNIEALDNQIQIQINICKPDRKILTITMSPEAFGLGATGLGQPCKVEIGTVIPSQS